MCSFKCLSTYRRNQNKKFRIFLLIRIRIHKNNKNNSDLEPTVSWTENRQQNVAKLPIRWWMMKTCFLKFLLVLTFKYLTLRKLNIIFCLNVFGLASWSELANVALGFGSENSYFRFAVLTRTLKDIKKDKYFEYTTVKTKTHNTSTKS